MTWQSKPILCIDDDNDTCELIKIYFAHEGIDVVTCNNADEGLRLARSNAYAAIILDNRLQQTDGVEVCREIRRFDTATPIIFSSADSQQTTQEKALEAGANAYFVKPSDFEQIVATTIKLVEESAKRKAAS
jgi:DNA-binding response OmpR family regulator